MSLLVLILRFMELLVYEHPVFMAHTRFLIFFTSKLLTVRHLHYGLL